MRKEITFDSFVRGLTIVAGVVVAYLLLNRLSSVLLPFCVAWLLSYLIYPIVTFLQYRCHLRYRIPSIIVALLFFLSILAGILLLTIPPTVREFAQLHGDIMQLVNEYSDSSTATTLDEYLKSNFDDDYVATLFQGKDMMEIVKVGAVHLWAVVANAFSVLKTIAGVAMMFLYLFFILVDYESLSRGIINLVPKSHRETAKMIMKDVQRNMHAYFRGQSLIALLVGIMFSIGFVIVGMPMAVGLGMFIGVLNLVPYLQVVGLVPAVLLALVKSNQTGENFWLIILYCFIVFIVVQSIQDLVLTPRIMGKMMGLRPAAILLSLSVWGSLLGFIGLIIALPLTTILVSYYKLFVLKEEQKTQ